MKTSRYRWLSLLLVLMFAAGCAEEDGADVEMSDFNLKFGAVAGDQAITCAEMISSLGASGDASVGLSDLRFYISNVKFWDADGVELQTTLDVDEFQYRSDAGEVALIDLTGNTEGTCASSAIAKAEGTARTHPALTGQTEVGKVARVSFDVGVPQSLMKEVIATNTAESAPSPLNEMYWSWASGYRHFVLNFAVDVGGDTGEGYVHVGSRDCGTQEGLALEDREACGFLNTPSVSIDIADLGTDVINIDVASILKDLDFKSPVRDPETFEVIGEQTGVECHSSPMQPDCPLIFGTLGVDIDSGGATATSNAVFSVK